MVGWQGMILSNNSKAGVAVASVFNALNYFVSEEEMNDIKDVMPTELKQFIKESIAVKETVL